MSVEINGIAHIQFTINSVRGLGFWESLCHFMGMETLIRNEDTVYCIGGRTGLLVRLAPEENRHEVFDQWRVGLHHFCIRARRPRARQPHSAGNRVRSETACAGDASRAASGRCHPPCGERIPPLQDAEEHESAPRAAPRSPYPPMLRAR